jgi:hypothetical protein
MTPESFVVGRQVLVRVGGVGSSFPGDKIVSVGNQNVGAIQKQGAQSDPDENRDRVSTRVHLYPGDYQTGETRREHHTRGESESAIEGAFRRMAPDEHERRAQQIQGCDDEPDSEAHDTVHPCER